MRILIDAVSARAGGGVSYLVNLLQILPKICPEDRFLVAMPEIRLPATIPEYANLEIRKIPEASSNPIRRYLWENTGLIDLCHSWKADLLFCVANIIPLRSPRIPVVVMIQNVAPLTRKVLYLMKKTETWASYCRMLYMQKLTLFAIRNSARVMVLSQDSFNLLQQWQPALKPEIAYHGIGSSFSPGQLRPPQAGSSPYFLFVSNFYIYKGLEHLINAISANPDFPRVMVIGKAYDTGYMQMIDKLIAENNCRDRLIFLDAVPYEELPGWYANAAALISPSWCESSSITLLESMACGCPVVAMRTGPMPEICGPAAFYAENCDAQSLATAMRAVLQTDREKISQASIERAAVFTWEKSMQQHARVFAEIAKPGEK
ncbi:MAG TPA: glycosyltransferase family 1 protein [Candidatus Rifleibacterium sp.]|nr:glycosyltransferase family 1 protein [Candidatus Rifleibacterium sp.]